MSAQEGKNERMLRLFKWLNKLMEQRYLYSIRASFISVMPLMIVGAYAIIINQLPVPAYQQFMLDTFGEGWRNFGGFIFSATTQILSLYVVFAIGSNLAAWYNSHHGAQVHGGICGMVGLACYIILSIPAELAAGLPFELTGATGLFMAMVTGIVAGELFIRLCCRKHALSLLSDDPNIAVPESFVAILPSIIIVAGFALVRVTMVYMGLTEGVSTLANNFLSSLYSNLGDSIGSAVLYNVSTHMMWLLGIHGNNVLDGVASQVFVPAMEANVAAAAAGLPIPHLLTKTLFDTFVYMGGSGTTLALLLALFFFGRGRGYRTLMRYALPNSLFNINEPVIFGIPIVLNPIYALPFVLTPVVMLLTTTLAMTLGLVPYTTAEVSWATPIFVSGYLATGSVAGSLLQAVNLALAVGLYTPFVRLAEKMDELRFERTYQQLLDVVQNEYSAASRRLIYHLDEKGAVARHLANQLGQAMDHGEMYLCYQPIVDADTHRMHSVEALLRWNHPRHGLINPMLTVALAEETGLIHRLGLWVVEEAVRQRGQWTAQQMEDFHVSVNVSSFQLDDPDFYRKVLDILERYGVPPAQLQVEVTETAALLDNDATHHNITGLHKAGVTLAMDDFGVGHSSLLYLRTQPISTLKIDGSLSREVVSQPANLDIISTIFDLCKQLQVNTVIEYVEDETQLRQLQSVGAVLVQGYLYSPPVRGAEIAGFLQELEER